jgi:hypothetical protein
MCLFSRTLVTVALVQEKHNQQKHEYGGDVEWRKESLGTRLLECSFDTNLTRHINNWRDGGKVHLLQKKTCFFHDKAARWRQSFKNDFDRRTFFNRRDV